MFKKIFNLFIGEENQNKKLIRNIEHYEQKEKAKQQKSKVLAKGPKVKNRVLMCTTHHGCKVYGIWYENE